MMPGHMPGVLQPYHPPAPVSYTHLDATDAPEGTERPDGRFAGEVTNPFSALKAMINSDEEV